VAGAWEVQDRMDRLADAADNPRGLDRALATMSAVAEQRTKLQVSHAALDWNQSLQVTFLMCLGSLLVGAWSGVMRSYLQCGVQNQDVP